VRNGYRVFDADTHVHATAESLERYLSSRVRELVPELDSFRSPFRTGWAGEKLEPPFRHLYRFERRGGWGGGQNRILGEAGPREGAEREFQHFMGEVFPTLGSSDYDPDARIGDMDREGVDVHLMVPAGLVGHQDPEVEMEFVRANHRYLSDFCSEYPHRLKSLIVVTPRAMEESVEEIKRWAGSGWAVGVQPHLPLDYPIDHPDMDPIWAAADEANLAIVHHSFSWGYPAYRDLWDNPFLGRLGSHPFAAMRAMAAFIGAGIMDRYPNLRFGILESGFGWLPFWARRMDDQAVYMGHVNENLQYRLSEYVTGGRFFASIVLHEGEQMVKMVMDDLGDHVLMFGSDYPHAESRFPGSVDKVLSWNALTPDRMQKLMWDNPVGFFGEP
jgi:predicted TIM-barrel fold metal-dependent hydrolase